MDCHNPRFQPKGIVMVFQLCGGTKMHRRFLVLVAFSLTLGSPWMFAQQNRFELNGLIGYTFSEGVDVERQEEASMEITRISPKRAFSYGLGMDYFFTESFAVGFNFGQQKSTLRASLEDYEGLDITDMKVNNYHAILTYNFWEEDEILRPFVFGGIGATGYSPADIGGQNIEGSTRFSTTWGGGVKYYTSEHLGFRGGIRWTPTYFKSESGGIFCSSHSNWNCQFLDDSGFSHQFEFSVGIIARF